MYKFALRLSGGHFSSIQIQGLILINENHNFELFR